MKRGLIEANLMLQGMSGTELDGGQITVEMERQLRPTPDQAHTLPLRQNPEGREPQRANTGTEFLRKDGSVTPGTRGSWKEW